MARFIVLVPTLNGARTLDDTLATCCAQDHEGVRVVVSDNWSEDTTADLVRAWQARDRRIEYLRPERRLSMSSHWEFALRALMQDDAYVTVLGCDDVLMPGALRYANELLGMFPESQCLAWHTNYYHTPDLQDPSVAGRMLLHLGGDVEVREARVGLSHVASGRTHYLGLPNLYHGLTHTALLRELAQRPGPMIRSLNPDIYLSIAVSCLLQRYLFVREPLSLNVISRQSNGFSHSNDHADKEVGRRVMQDNDRPYHPDLPFSDDLHIAHVECLLQVQDAGLLPHDIPIEFKLMFGQAVQHTYGCYQSHTREKRLEQLKVIARKYFLQSFMEEVETACGSNDLARLSSLVPTAWTHPPFDYDTQIGRHLSLSPQAAALLAGELIRTDRLARGRCLNQVGRFLDTARAEHDQSKIATLAEQYQHMISSTVGELWTRPEFIRCYISHVKSRLLAFNPASYLWALTGMQEEGKAPAKSPEPMITYRGEDACVDASTNESSASKRAEVRIGGGCQSEERMSLSIFLTDANSGDVRLGIPYFYGQRRYGWKGIFARPQMEEVQVGGEEIWLIQRLSWVSDDTLERAQRSGTRIVHDLDDMLWEIPADNPNKVFLTDSRIESLFRQLNKADQVTVSTEPLAEELSRKGIRSVVLPNCVAPERWTQLRPVRRAGKRPRVGWAGQRSVHFSDLELLRQVMDDLGDEVEWVFLGDTPVFARESGRQVESFSMVPIQQYPAQLAALNLDLALAPLSLNRFNEAKSDIRLLHYGALGYPVVATDIAPHREAPVKRVANHVGAWVNAIRERIYDLDAAEREGEALRKWVFEMRSIAVWIARYASAWLGRVHEERNYASAEPRLRQRGKTQSFTCSIVIPVLNKVELTKQCLVALADVTQGVDYEVIIVDNGSSDGTQEFLGQLGGDVQVIRNPDNFGFAKACNQGAQAASGQYLVFLNNDTIPIKGWLNALVQEVESHQDVGVVGSKLLYGDGTVQHAGVVFSRQWLTPYHHHRGVAADLPFVNRRREFQSVTAACMLVRRDLFSEVGGFDEAYRNGFEDVDLCLKIKQQGWRVIYQPSSVLYHLESQTPGRKDHDVENHRLFTARWGACWWLTDEDLVAFQDGFCMEYLTTNSAQWRPLENAEEHRRWRLVADTQQAAGQRDDSTVLKKLEQYSEWPADRSVLKWAASVAGAIKQPALASAFARRVTALDDPAAEQLAMIREALANGQVTSASSRLEALLKCHPTHAEGLLLKAILHMQREQYEQAESAFDLAMQQGADRKKCVMGMGMAAMGRAYTQGAWERFLQVLAEHPDDPEAIHWLLRAGTAQNRWQELAEQLHLYTARNPGDLAARFAFTSVLLRGEQIEAARREYDTLCKLDPQYDGHGQLGQAIAGREAALAMEAASS